MWMDLISNPSFLHQVFQNNDETVIYKMNSIVRLETQFCSKIPYRRKASKTMYRQIDVWGS